MYFFGKENSKSLDISWYVDIDRIDTSVNEYMSMLQQCASNHLIVLLKHNYCRFTIFTFNFYFHFCFCLIWRSLTCQKHLEWKIDTNSLFIFLFLISTFHFHFCLIFFCFTCWEHLEWKIETDGRYTGDWQEWQACKVEKKKTMWIEIKRGYKKNHPHHGGRMKSQMMLERIK